MSALLVNVPVQVLQTINVKKIDFGNKEHTANQKMGVSVLLREPSLHWRHSDKNSAAIKFHLTPGLITLVIDNHIGNYLKEI